MRCRKIQKLLPLYISEDLDAPQMSEVENHLSQCLSCHREFQNHQNALGALGALGDKPDLASVMDGFTDEIMDKIRADEGGVAAPVPRVMYTYLPRTLAAAALVMVLISAGFYMLRPEPVEVSPENGFVRESAPAVMPDSGMHSMEPSTIQPFLVASDFTGVSGPGTNAGKQPTDDEEIEEPYLDPLPHKFPRVQPVNYKRDF